MLAYMLVVSHRDSGLSEGGEIAPSKKHMTIQFTRQRNARGFLSLSENPSYNVFAILTAVTKKGFETN